MGRVGRAWCREWLHAKGHHDLIQKTEAQRRDNQVWLVLPKSPTPTAREAYHPLVKTPGSQMLATYNKCYNKEHTKHLSRSKRAVGCRFSPAPEATNTPIGSLVFFFLITHSSTIWGMNEVVSQVLGGVGRSGNLCVVQWQ